MVLGTSGAVELTFGTGSDLPTALWFREAQPKLGIPILTPETDVDWKSDSFWRRETKIARDWLLAKGIMTSDETHSPIDSELASFFSDIRSGSRPKADVEVGLRNSTAVILSNLAMQENRRVNWSEIEKMGLPQPIVAPPPALPAPIAPAEKPVAPQTDPA